MGDEYPSLFRTLVLHIFSNLYSLYFTFTTAGSEQMSLVQLFVPTEVAHDTVAELGELGNVQFKDVSCAPKILNLQLVSYPAHMRHFVVEPKCKPFSTLLRW